MGGFEEDLDGGGGVGGGKGCVAVVVDCIAHMGGLEMCRQDVGDAIHILLPPREHEVASGMLCLGAMVSICSLIFLF